MRKYTVKYLTDLGMNKASENKRNRKKITKDAKN